MTYLPSNLHKLFEPGSPFEARGFNDAIAGRTANPYGTPTAAADWARGHDFAVDHGLSDLPRYGRIARSRNDPRKRRNK